MITNLLQSIGVVFAILIVVALAIVSMYISYILAIGVIILSLLFITYHVISSVKECK
jgi:hypothetical protein